MFLKASRGKVGKKQSERGRKFGVFGAENEGALRPLSAVAWVAFPKHS